MNRMGHSLILKGVARAAYAGRRLGLVERVRWMKRLMKPLLGEMVVEVGGLTLCGTLDHWELLDQLRREQFEPATGRMFRDVITSGQTIVDIGSCIGWYALLAVQLTGAHGRVFAFEPNARNFTWLSGNIQRNGFGNIEAIPKAVSSRDDSVALFLHEGDPTQNSLYPPHAGGGCVHVDAIALDSFLDEKRVDVIKVDIEGGELSALRGMQDTLRRNPHLLLFVELNPRALQHAGTSEQKLVHWLHEAGFLITPLDPRRAPDGSLIAVNLFCRRDSTR